MHHTASTGDLSRTIEAYAAGRALDFPTGDNHGARAPQPVAKTRRDDTLTAFIEAAAGHDTPRFGGAR